MPCSEERFKCSRLVVVVMLLLLLRAIVGGCNRPINKGTTSLGHLYNTRLSRGPVSPSRPSPCHEKLQPYRQSHFSYPNDFIICL
ncbi:hypothetical protein like AT2G01379 [Hibiscus trionum]|uniref:Secreted protein n=1 Tax=Hibiscus trionum TaxID=183268 RepID=A0A9W7HDV0_HIBTR|nr:hypothetical protein like AT2G01379 [Hibiscus trionum]